MNPTFNFNHVDGVGNDESQVVQFPDVYFPQWGFPGPRTSINSVPSPTDTIPTVRTAPALRTPNRASFRPPSRDAQYASMNGILPNDQYLAPPGPKSVHANRNNVEPIVDPILRFYQGDGPWDPMRNSANATRNISFGQYRQGPRSDLDSNVPISDSGYYTHPTRSVLSNEPGHVDQELPPEVMRQTKTLLHMQPVPNVAQDMIRTASDQRSVSQHSNRSGNPRQKYPCSEPDCNEVSKCKSDQKKHMLKHKKPHVCTVPDCKRNREGFSTVNDLDRHKKSVHKIGITKTKSYLCAAEICKNKGKIWPRLDNFKQHIERMHKGIDEFDLIKRSEYHPQETQTMVPPLSVDPAYLLAGMDTDTTVTRGDPNDSILSAGSQSFSYPQSMSFSGRSTSNQSLVSPITNTLDISFSENTTIPSGHGAGNLLDIDTFVQSAETFPERQPGHRNSSHVSPAGTASRSTLVQGSVDNRNSMLQLQLPGAPQTKAEQQRQTFSKLPKTSIEEIVLSVLNAQQQQSGNGSNTSVGLSDDGRVQVSRAIAKLVKQKTKPARPQQRRPTQGSASGMQHCRFEDCSFFGRPCDLNKHMKRHQKPYGCTYPKCHKRFGAKSDWKRHENSQHFQQEAFRCEYADSSGQKCGQHYYRAAQFQAHVVNEHKVNSSDRVQEDLKRCKIGKNCQVQYWCGFCQEIKPLKNKRNAAWDERFDHIAYHFEKEKKRIDNWVCVEENRTKKQLQEDMMNRDDEEEKDPDADAEGASDDEMPAPTARSLCMSTQGSMNKRPAPADAEVSPRPEKRTNQPTLLWLCCECQEGFVTTLQISCPHCQHAKCKGCDCFEPPGGPEF